MQQQNAASVMRLRADIDQARAMQVAETVTATTEATAAPPETSLMPVATADVAPTHSRFS